MDAIDPVPEFSEDDERRVLDAWAHGSRQAGEPGDRAALASRLLRALARSGCAIVQLASAAAAYASARAASHLTLAELVAELDLLESAVLSVVAVSAGMASDHAPAAPRSSPQRIHECCSVVRRVAIAAYGQTLTAEARARLRSARHDIVNAIGAVRNSMLIMDDEPAGTGRERLRAIARRNSRRSEALVRTYLADDSVLTGAVGWAEVGRGDSSHSHDALNGGSAKGARGAITDIAAARALQHVLECAGAADADVAVSGSLPAARTSGSTTTAPATALIQVKPPADSPLWQTHALAAFHEFATALGVQFEADANSGSLRFLLPLFAGHPRDDLGSSSEAHDRDAVGF